MPRLIAVHFRPVPQPDLFVCALEEWRDRASKPFPGLDTDTAALLLEWAARGHGWQHTARLHKARCKAPVTPCSPMGLRAGRRAVRCDLAHGTLCQSMTSNAISLCCCHVDNKRWFSKHKVPTARARM